MRRIGNVINQKAISNGGVVSIVADDPFLCAFNLLQERAAHDFELSLRVPRSDTDRSTDVLIGHARSHDLCSRMPSHETSVIIDRCAFAAHSPMWRVT